MNFSKEGLIEGLQKTIVRIPHVSTESRESALQTHLGKMATVNRKLSDVMKKLDEGGLSVELLEELGRARFDRGNYLIDGIPRSRAIVSGQRVLLELPPIRSF